MPGARHPNSLRSTPVKITEKHLDQLQDLTLSWHRRLTRGRAGKRNLVAVAPRYKSMPPEHAPFALWATWYGVTISRWEPHPGAQRLVPEALTYSEQDLLQALNHALAESWPEIWR